MKTRRTTHSTMTDNMKHIVADVESNGLLPELTVIHSLVLRDLHSGECISCADQKGYKQIRHGLSMLQKADRVYFHNGIKFDYPALRKVYPSWDIDKSRLIDTLVVSRVIYAHLKELDFALKRKGKLPGHLVGKHSLESWGYRLGLNKGEYTGGWDSWTPELQTYCELDTDVLRRLVMHLRKRGFSKQAVHTELEFAWQIAQQELNGVPFDMDKAHELQATLAGERQKAGRKLTEAFGSWYKRGKEFTPKRDNKRYGYKAGATCTKIEMVTFNPASRIHIAEKLTEKYGWEPKKFTDGGRPEVNEETLLSLNFPEAEIMNRYLMVDKRLSQLAEGKQAWLKSAVFASNGNGWTIYGSCNPNGTVTHRGSHSHPNLGQVVNSSSPYGDECRELFIVPPGWYMVGADACGIELRMLAHFMAKYDDGAYVKEVIDGDPHTRNMEAWGLNDRNKGKTCTFGYLYGCGNLLLGTYLDSKASEKARTALGKEKKAKFERDLPALGYLVKAVKKKAKEDGYIYGLDGRYVHCRSEHSALNTLLQCAGSLVVKYWLIEAYRQLYRELGPDGWDHDWAGLLWVHDERQYAARTEKIVNTMSDILVRTMPPIQDLLNLRVPLAAEAKVGKNWRETH